MEPTEANAITDWGDKQGGGREVDMSDPDVLRDFIKWAVRNYPAKRYALIVADHGFGWKGLVIDNTNYQRTMSIKQLSQAIKESRLLRDVLRDVGSNTTLHCKRKNLNRCSPTRILGQTEIDIAEWEE